MPKLYEYLGIIVYFWSNEHEPIHVHGEYQVKESTAEIIIDDGNIVEISFSNVKGRRPLDSKELKRFKLIVKNYADEIVQKWIDYFILQKKIPFKRISKI